MVQRFAVVQIGQSCPLDYELLDSEIACRYYLETHGVAWIIEQGQYDQSGASEMFGCVVFAATASYYPYPRINAINWDMDNSMMVNQDGTTTEGLKYTTIISGGG